MVRPIKRPGGVGGDVAPSLAIKDWTASWTLRVVNSGIWGELRYITRRGSRTQYK